MISPVEQSNRSRFKSHLKKIGSGENTSKGLTREESANALELMLKAQASPAQIGAFMIAHRIRRPEPQELAGMLDTYVKLGPKLISNSQMKCPICFGMPFDGRTKTSPIYPLTTLVLLSAKQPVIIHGGKKMPIKYGVTSLELFQILGLNLENLSIKTVQKGFLNNQFALIHQPDHFPLADTLIPYRDDLGKRPPIASMELLWTSHKGDHLLVSGFVHPPTEQRAWECLDIIGEKHYITVKGLEGSTDLSISRKCITAHIKNNKNERLILHPRDYQCFGKDVEWQSIEIWKDQALRALKNRGELKNSLHWNAGFYFWRSGISKNLEEGIEKTKSILISGEAQNTLEKLISWKSQIAQHSNL